VARPRVVPGAASLSEASPLLPPPNRKDRKPPPASRCRIMQLPGLSTHRVVLRRKTASAFAYAGVVWCCSLPDDFLGGSVEVVPVRDADETVFVATGLGGGLAGAGLASACRQQGVGWGMCSS
jgi:hypothetical protein